MDAVHNVPCTFVSNWIEGTTHVAIFHKLWKLLLQVVCILPIFITFSHKSQWKIWLVHDKLWKWLLQVGKLGMYLPIFIAFSHKRQWKIRLVHDKLFFFFFMGNTLKTLLISRDNNYILVESLFKKMRNLFNPNRQVCNA